MITESTAVRTAKGVNEKEAMDDLLTADEFADRPREGSLHNAHVYGRLRRRLRGLALVDDLSPSQAAVLTRLHKEGPSSASVLARAEAVSHQAIGAILAVLDNRGFIQRSPDPTGQRDQLSSTRYDGKYYQLAETLCSPQPVQRPNPPVLLGGTGERKTLRLVAQYADSWNGAFQTVDEAAHKIDVLYRHCDAVGRDPGEIQKTAFMLIDPMADLDGFLTIAEQYAGLGFDLINVMPPVDETDPVAFASRLGEHIIPRVAQLSVAENSAR